MNRSLLFITFQYPPVQASSGLLRSLSFTRELAAQGWKITVLTSAVTTLESRSSDNLNLIPKDVEVVRSRAFDAAKSFSIGGWYPGFLEWPDRYSSWILSATLAGIDLLRSQHYDCIVSTYPIASAHMVGYLLSRYSKTPWVADFRDPMVLPTHPDTRLRRHAHSWIEKRTIRACSAAVFTNDAAKLAYKTKYPKVSPKKLYCVENGFDENIFRIAIDRMRTSEESISSKMLRIVHSGTLYPDHRDPEPLLMAIKSFISLRQNDAIAVRFIFRATGYDQQYKAIINKLGLEEVVILGNAISYVESVKEMLQADGLILIQGSSCNDQIPAKIYEYLRSQKPILAITDREGATASCLVKAHIPVINVNGTEEKLRKELTEFIERISSKTAGKYVCQREYEKYSRQHRSMELKKIIETSIEPA